MRLSHVLPMVFLVLVLSGIALRTSVAQSGSIEGSWSGGGTAVLKTGQKEPVRCRISYEKSTGRTFIISANCSHANGTFQQSGRIVQTSENSYSGRLYSDQYSVSGDVSITVTGSSQTLSAVSEKGHATVVLKK